MTSNLLSIGASGAMAAEVALNLTGQNITNASTDGYVRRSANTVEVASASSWSVANDLSLSGVTVTGITRNADTFLEAEARRTASDTARANSTVAGLTDIESAVENSGVFTAIGNFQNALTALNQNPTATSLRAGVIQSGTTMASAFQIAGQGMSATRTGLQVELGQGLAQVNTLATQLASINNRMSASAGSATAASNVTTGDRANLMDQRDSLLNQIGQFANLATTINPDGSANVNLGGVSGPPLVSGVTANTLASTTNANGTMALAIGTAPVSLSGGTLAGNQAALVKLDQISTNLDTLATGIVTTVNTRQAAGVNLAGTTGAALFAGTTAATMVMTTSSGSAIATATAGSGAASADTTNLIGLNNALTLIDPSGTMNSLLTDISGAVQSAKTTQATLRTLSGAAASSLSAEAGVDLNAEAVNLVKFQQAFQASGKVMQVAHDIFTSILNLH
ncbi:flagellar hook-associated protein FlgK [Novosphingobium sp.]|uniref:flagellar hook-associated protein FlgK n=1 Tax=Novosphingobium sp. TaxID=1874826 RepID=UPI0033401051